MSRRRNPTRETYITIAIASTVTLVGLAIYGLTRPKTPISSVQPWNNKPIRAIQGIPITISVPRGEEFIIASPDIGLVAQVQRGNETHLVIQPMITGEPAYTINTVIVDRGSSRTYPIEVRAVPAEDMLESAGALPA